ncbi:hypothetical protein B9Z55_006781 [Caenorhabditis nigoni]|uniref:Uncharacterized protein n=1 Tax=Caenorhabditis nigoni TaxID=1611254 RepID=A0A2G5V6P8_9PELO|nr:hypothetical protein B9Z55_006781 [Caenorhabditis nigoni]
MNCLDSLVRNFSIFFLSFETLTFQIMRSSWIQNAIFLMVCSKVWADGSVCYQCATPNLESNWAITGLPLKPSNLAFEE